MKTSVDHLSIKFMKVLIIFLTVLMLLSPNVFANIYEGKEFSWWNQENVIDDKHPFIYSLEDRLFYESGVYLNLRDELALTDKQIEKIKGIKSTLKKELILKKAEISTIKVDIHSELEKDVLDPVVLKSLLGDKYNLNKAYAEKLVNHYMDLQSILSETQKEKLNAIYKANTKMGPFSDSRNDR